MDEFGDIVGVVDAVIGALDGITRLLVNKENIPTNENMDCSGMIADEINMPEMM